MTFKTWITDLTKLQGIVNNISKIELWENDDTRIFDSNAVDNLSSAISGLNQQQAQLVLSTIGLKKEEMNQIFVEAGLIASENKIQAELVKTTLAQSGLSKEQQKAILGGLNLINLKTNEAIATAYCTKEELLNMLATKGITGAKAEEIIATLGLTSANQAETLSRGLLIKAMWEQVKAQGALMLSNPITWIMGIPIVINLAVKAFNALTDSVEEVKERVDELMSSYISELDEANNKAKTIRELTSEYEELSKGVNGLGTNISLTEEDFSRYHDIVNQISNISPELVDGWDAQGNAIINLKGNVDSLTESYKKAQIAAYNTLIDGADDVIKNYQNFFNLTESGTGTFSDFDLLEIANRFKNVNSADQLKDVMASIRAEYVFDDTVEIQDVYEALGLKDILNEFELYDDNLTDEIAKEISIHASTYVFNLQSELETRLSNMRSIADAYLNVFMLQKKEYQNIDQDIYTALSRIVNSIDTNTIESLELNSPDAVSSYVQKLLNAVTTGENKEEVSQALVGLFNLDTSEMSLDDAKAQVDQYIKCIADVTGESEFNLKVRLGFDNIDQTANNYHNILDNAARKASGATLREIRNQTGNYEKYQEIYAAMDEFANEYYINTQDELAYFQNALEDAKYDIDKAFELYLSKMQDDLDDDTSTPTISSSVEQISRQLEPQFAKLGDAYTSIFPDDGFNLDVVDNPMLEDLRKTFAEIDEETGVTFDPNKINDFFDALENGTANVENIEEAAKITQDAFNDLATAYFYSTDTLEHLNEATAESIKQQLEQMGVVNSEEIIDHYLQLAEAENGLIEIQKKLTEAQKDLAESSNAVEYDNANARIDLIYEQIEAYYNEKCVTEDLRIALFNLQLQQAGLSIESINSSSSVDELINLAGAAGLSSEHLERLIYLQQLFSRYQTATNEYMRSDISSRIQYVKSELENGLESPQIDLEVYFPNDSAKNAGKDAADEYMDAFNEEFNRLKFLQDNGIITEKEYLDQLRILYEKYFKAKEEYFKEYVEYERQYLNGLKSLYEDVLGGITDLLDQQIDKTEEERDAKIDALEEEQEARTKVLEQQKEQLDLQIEEIEAQIKGKNDAIDAINDEIDAIRKANDERQRQIDLQKALYDLERMQNQRTILQYSEDKGMHYVSDTSGIRDAKDAVDDAKREIEIADKEKQIALIEDEISLLETRKSLIEDQQTDLDKQIDALDEYYKKLIENTEAYYSALIQPIENYKTQFESIADFESDATFDEQLKSLGYSVDDILALSSSTLENFKSNYLGILSDIYAGNSQMLDSLSMISGLDQDEFVGYLSQSQPYIDSLARLDLSSTQLAIDSANSGIYSFADGAVLATTNMTTMADTVTSLLEGDKKQAGIISSFETMTSVLADANTQIAGIASGMEELDGKTATIRINIETNGDTGLLGNAFVSGTAITGASHVEGTALASGNWAVQSNEKNALVGEVGRELIVRGGRFFTVGNYGAEMFNIKKGDIVFNHEQTEALLKNGHISGRGKAYADGNVGGGRFLTADGRILRPLQESDKGFELLQKFQPLVDRIIKGEEGLITNAVFDSQKQFEQMLKSVMNTTAINNISNNRNSQPVVHQQFNITMPNVTNSTSAEILMNDLQSLSTKKFQMEW